MHLVFKKTYTPFPCPFLAKLHPCLFISLLSSLDRNAMNKQGYGLERKGTWKRGNTAVVQYY